MNNEQSRLFIVISIIFAFDNFIYAKLGYILYNCILGINNQSIKKIILS